MGACSIRKGLDSPEVIINNVASFSVIYIESQDVIPTMKCSTVHAFCTSATEKPECQSAISIVMSCEVPKFVLTDCVVFQCRNQRYLAALK